MISAVILTKNEEKNIEKCLKCLLWCDEIIVIDDYSIDSTLKIARKYKSRIYKRNLNGDFAGQRNFGLEKAKNEWVLFIDADEIVSNKLANEIINETDDSYISKDCGFSIKRKDVFLGKKMNYGETGNVQILRLAKKRSGKWKRKVHEIWNVNGKVQLLHNELIHNHDQSLSDFINKINSYSSIHAIENGKEGKKSSIFKYKIDIIIIKGIPPPINLYISFNVNIKLKL